MKTEKRKVALNRCRDNRSRREKQNQEGYEILLRTKTGPGMCYVKTLILFLLLLLKFYGDNWFNKNNN